jgi:transposase
MDLTEEQRDFVEPLIPKPRRRSDGRGRPWRDPRDILDAVLWILRTGAPWKDLPERYPPYQTCHRRYQQWCRDGTIERVLHALAEHLYKRGGIDITEAFIDGTFAGAKKGASPSGKPSAARAQRSWRSQTVMVFLSPPGLRVLRRMKRSSSKRRSMPVFSASHPIVLLETVLTTAIRSTRGYAKKEESS